MKTVVGIMAVSTAATATAVGESERVAALVSAANGVGNTAVSTVATAVAVGEAQYLYRMCGYRDLIVTESE